VTSYWQIHPFHGSPGSVFYNPDPQDHQMIIQAIVPTLGQNRVKPRVYFKPIAHPTSDKPAMKR
jgi:hypothetical protein